MRNNDAVEGVPWSTPRRTLQIIVISVLVSFVTKLNIGYSGSNWAEHLGSGVADGILISGAAALVVLTLMLFTKFRLPTEFSNWKGFLAAMAIPSICVAPLQIWRSYTRLEERKEGARVYNQIQDKARSVKPYEAPLEYSEPNRKSIELSPIDANIAQLKEMARSGDPFAQALFGYALSHGTHNKKAIMIEQEEAVKWIRKSAKARHPLGLALMGSLREGGPMWSSRWVVQDKEAALIDFEEALKNGLERGAENGGAVWCTIWGKSLAKRHGLPRDPRDDRESMKWYQKAAQLGDATAEGAIGFLYFIGGGIAMDWNEAAKWYRIAAEHGDAVSAQRLGIHCSSDGSVAAPDSDEAIKWFRQAAEQGDGLSAWMLTSHYKLNDTKDLDEAIKWCRKSVDSGMAEESDLEALVKSKAMEDEAKRNFQLNKNAAEQGDVKAKFWLGLSYSSGDGVNKDEAEAARWFQKAAEKGDASAQIMLGWSYSDGNGVPKDLVMAYMWFNLGAAVIANDKIKQEIEKISKMMTKQQLADAQKMYSEWKPKSNDVKH